MKRFSFTSTATDGMHQLFVLLAVGFVQTLASTTISGTGSGTGPVDNVVSGGAAGDPHYTTFDGAQFSFQGACKYLLCGTDERFDRDLGERVWKVYVQNKMFIDEVTGEAVAFTAMVHIAAHGHIISVREYFKCKIDGGEEVSWAALRHGRVVGMRNHIYVQAELTDDQITAVVVTVPKLNFQVRFDGRGIGGRHSATVNLLAYRRDMSDLMTYAGKLCGILGNFDGNMENDLFPHGSTTAGSATEIGNSYQIDKETCD